MDRASFWALVVLLGAAALSALVAAATALRAARVARAATLHLEAARAEVTASHREWLERTAAPRRQEPMPPVPPPPPYRIDVREDTPVTRAVVPPAPPPPAATAP